MSVITDVVDVTIDATTATITREGFGVPLIVSHNAAWAERVREYATLAAVALDFAVTTPEYLAATALFSAARRPPKVLIGRANTNKPTQRWAVTPTAANLGVYTMTVGGNAVTFTADASATVSEINIGLKAAIDLLSLPLTVTDETTFMRIVQTVAGAWASVSTTDSKLSVVQDHADVATGLATELALIAIERNDWYALITLYNSEAYVTAAAAWANAQPKLYVFQTSDSDVPNTVLAGAVDVVSTLKALNYDHVVAIYSKSTGDFADAAWLGRCLPLDPGSETWKFKVLVGVPVGAYTSTQRANMRAKNCNFYEDTRGQPMTEEGKAVGGQFIDFVRYVDYLKSELSLAVFTPFVEEDRIPFNDAGITAIENLVAGQLQIDEKRGVLNQGWTTAVPKLVDISAADKTARLLQGVEFSAVYAGAIHKVKISGRITQ